MTIGCWLNGEPATHIDANDRGLSYGDGLFTTILVRDGKCCLIERHIDRLVQGCVRLKINNVDIESIECQIFTLATSLTSGIIKVVITRGIGARGYSSVGCDSPSVIVTTSTLPRHYQNLRNSGISAGISSIPLGINPITAGLKHLNRLEQVLVRQEIDRHSWDDAIVLDCQGFVVESNLANVFWLKGGRLFTPSLELSGVCGVMREHVIAQCKNSGYDIEIGRFPLDELLKADEIFITNSLMELVPVVMVAQHNFPIGQHIKQISALIIGKGNCGKK